MACVVKLIRVANLARADDAYEMLVALHAGCSADESLRINARLILTLFNHIGDLDIISEAVALAAGTDDRTHSD